MFPNSSNLGRPPFPPKQQQQSHGFNELPLNTPFTLITHRPITDTHLSYQNAVLSRTVLSGSVATVPVVTLPSMSCGNDSPAHRSDTHIVFQGRKRPSGQSGPPDIKRQRFHSQYSEAVPLPEEHRYSFLVSALSPPFPKYWVPDLTACVPPLQETLFPDLPETVLPVAKDELSQQILELFKACQQQTCDLKRKELCRAELQREIQQIFPHSRLFLVGSSLNGFGTRSSDGDLCLVIKEQPVNQKTEARHILSLVHKHFSTKLSGYIERPQLIRAKVPIVKFRDKVSCVEFDLNVNNIVGIRNTFLLRTYAYALPEPILPSLQKNYPLQFVHRAPRIIPPYQSKNASSLGDLLIGFFEYYATEFDWSHQMISVREAKALPRPDGIEWRNKFICVEEPFDGTNTARAVHEKQKFNIIKVLAGITRQERPELYITCKSHTEQITNFFHFLLDPAEIRNSIKIKRQ
ncbi:poly(A) RNA polymerase GLD2 isoform X7 [Colius striatus]|uniref:poly(A) RNA polymerase GLD2 isoform X7 n=1 Tax=Colius striatus TaxID=57412 RepID=UPI002B1D3BB2|nr:poly(A) RNA polymerase GLD2 isoform X7 [Colius striatus]